MKLKEGVILAGIQVQMNPVLVESEGLWEEEGQEVVITAGLDGEHKKSTLHSLGYALDLRTRYFPKENHQRIADELQRRLGDEYDVIVHDTHIHVEWDKAKQYLGR